MNKKELKDLFLAAWDINAEAAPEYRARFAFHYLVGALIPREDWELFT